jgi:molecular chaperone IbpA
MFDLSPLYRSTVGFDRLAQLLDNVGSFEVPAYPPYNIERVGDDEYRVTMAVAGFGQDDITVEVKQNTLTVSGKKADKTESRAEFLHQGIAQRAFERRFQLADHVEVTGADLKDGLLHVDLVRNVPEKLKPRQIPVGNGAKQISTSAKYT